MTPLTVRQAVLADLEAVAAVFDQYRQFQGQPADLPACRAFLRKRFYHAESVVFLTTSGLQPVGLAQLYPSFSSMKMLALMAASQPVISSWLSAGSADAVVG